MADAKYAFQGMTDSMARAMKRDAEISMKVALEMAAFLKGKKTSQAKTILGRVLAKKQAVPFKRFNDGVGHRPGAGITAGRYPQKGSEIFIALIESAEKNAQAKGLSSDLKIIHLAPQKATGGYHYGRQRRRKFKRAHLEIVIAEMEKDAKTAKKTVKAKSEKAETEKAEAHQHEHTHADSEAQSHTEKPKKKVQIKKANDAQEDKQ